MKGVFYILLSYLCGELISLLIGRFIPGSVLGMLVLFGALQSGAIKSDDVKSFASLLLDNMMLFFVPISVGLMTTFALIGSNLWTITVILIVTTLLVIAVVGWLQQKIGGHDDR